tara:strand:+ start:364 stop:912 length:549 start_codon:yes stop_codon:yes gene_type:complete
MKEQQLIIESLLFVASEPLLQSDIDRVFDSNDTPSLDNIVKDINLKYADHAFEIKGVGKGYMLVSKREFEPFISKYVPSKKLMLSNASLEVLAIIAYKQPISRIDIESIRGVDCKGVLKNLLNKKLIKIGGRDDSLGRALLYHTTDDYLKHFGLTSLSEMPTSNEISDIIDSEDSGIINEAI